MRLTVLTAALLLAVGNGCSGGNDATATQPPATTSSTASSEAMLKQAVRAALLANDRLSGYVLWSNRVPRWAAQSTRGPALVALRRSAMDRRTRGVRVRTISSTLDIRSIALDPSYTSARAVVRSIQRVRAYKGATPSANVTRLDERATVELRRVGKSERFVVWKLGAAP